MNRVSTSGGYSSVLANLMSAQQRQAEAGDQLSTGKVGTDLKAFSRNAQVLTAMQTLDTRLTGFTEQNAFTANRLEIQDLALNKAADAADRTRLAISNALASDRADALMTELQGHFSNGVSALNTRHAGKYLFAGGQVDTPPVSAKQLSDLTAPSTVIADFFHNDDYIDKARVDETTTLNVGQLADDLGTSMLTAYKDLQAFEEGGAGPFSGKLTAAQRTFLESQIAVWSSVHSDLVTAAAKNGAVQTQLDSVKTSMTARQTTIQGMIGDVSNADLAKAASALTQAQQSLQASSQVFLALQGASLLNVLR